MYRIPGGLDTLDTLPPGYGSSISKKPIKKRSEQKSPPSNSLDFANGGNALLREPFEGGYLGSSQSNVLSSESKSTDSDHASNLRESQLMVGIVEGFDAAFDEWGSAPAQRIQSEPWKWKTHSNQGGVTHVQKPAESAGDQSAPADHGQSPTIETTGRPWTNSPLHTYVNEKSHSEELVASLESMRMIRTITSQLDEDVAFAILSDLAVSDAWLPLPTQTIRRAFMDMKLRKDFARVQSSFFAQPAYVHHSLNGFRVALVSKATDTSNSFRAHMNFEDGDDFITSKRVLGEGGVGYVEEVALSDSVPQTTCVRKKIARPKPYKAQKKMIEAFVKEVKVMHEVHHRHCIEFVGSYTDLDSLNILMSPVADMDLSALLSGPIGPREKQILYQGMDCICHAVLYLHEKRIRHEDLKPQNVLIYGEKVLLTDFGFSLDFSDDSVSTTTGRPIGWTPRYSPPEVLDFEPRNRASDIYSLGCILAEMLSGLHGHNLTELKEYWRLNGNNQPSFARNSEAAEQWLNSLARTSGTRTFGPKNHHFRDLISYMLHPDRLMRPTARQVTDRLSDLSVLEPPSIEYHSRCCLHVSDSVTDFARSLEESHSPRYLYQLTDYFYPSQMRNRTYLILDLDFTLLASKHDCYDSFETLCRQPKDLILACDKLQLISRRRHGLLWDEHFGSLPGYSKLHSQWAPIQQIVSSAERFSLKDTVLTAVQTEVRVPTSSTQEQATLSDNYVKRTVQISLMPVTTPKSQHQGKLFYFISFRIADVGYDLPDIFTQGSQAFDFTS